MQDKPWITGPKELLVHGLDHLELASNFDYRIGMISIDNSVELMIKTYLGLPRRVTKIEGLTRKKLEEMQSSFPALLDGLEEFASERLDGIDLGDIEWFHRIRNQLYHDGNGITVEKEKVQAYAEIAKILFENLFDQQIENSGPQSHYFNVTGEFIKLWADLERQDTPDAKNRPYLHRIKEMINSGELSKEEGEEFIKVRQFRNNLVHGMGAHTSHELEEALHSLKKIYSIVKDKST